jgi:hypothetical protein
VPLPEDLDRIDITLRQLHAKWDLYFSGAERKPPLDLQAQVEALIRQWANQEIRNGGERFRYQGLAARFTTFNELWQKRLRAREEGKVFGMHGLRAEQIPPVAPRRDAPAAPEPKPGPSSEFRVGDPQRDQAAIRALYDRFVEERQRTGEGQPPAFDSFQKLIAKQAEKVRSEKGASAIDFRLETRDGKVALKARVVK